MQVAVLQQHPSTCFSGLSYSLLRFCTLSLAERDASQRFKLLFALGKRSECLQRICSWQDEDQGCGTRGVIVRALDVKERRIQIFLTLFFSHILSHCTNEGRWSKSLDETQLREPSARPLFTIYPQGWEIFLHRPVTVSYCPPLSCVGCEVVDYSCECRRTRGQMTESVPSRSG